VLGQNAPIEAAVDAFRRAQFGITDIMRRAQGDAVEAFGLGPSESDHRSASAPHWRLRDYGDRDASRSVLLVAAPIKRPYIWDLAPSASAIRRCLQHDLHVHLLEWMPASRSTCNNGLDEYTLAISDCVGKVSDRPPKTRPFLMGHSLGGTLAAIFGALAPETIRGLVLLGAPLCFQPGESQFRDALVALAPPDISEVDPFPGSLLSHMSALASPNTFVWSRLMDAALSVTDRRAMEIHARIERWASTRFLSRASWFTRSSGGSTGKTACAVAP